MMNRSQLLVALTRAAVVPAAVLALATVALALWYRRDAVGLGMAVLALVFLSVPMVGAAAARAGPRNPVAWILLACGVSLPLATAAYLYSHAAYAGAPLPAPKLAAWFDGWPWTPALTLVPLVGLLLFPDGRVSSWRWRPLLWTGWAVVLAQLINELFAPHLLDYSHLTNPTALPAAAGHLADTLGASIVLVAPIATLGALSVHLRWRHATPGSAAAAALKLVTPAAWFIAASWWGCWIAVSTTGNSNNALAAEALGMVALAVTAWIAMRRYGLLATRQVLNRALVYAALSACVLGLYVAVAAIIGSVTSAAVSQPAAVLIAVLVALPLRDWLQHAINHLLYGYADDPYTALVRLGHRLEDTAASDDVLPGVARTVREALRLPYIAIRIGETCIEDGRPTEDTVQFPLVFAGETVGLLLAGRRDPDQSFRPHEERLLSDIAQQAAAAARAVSLTQDLRRSRERLITATEEERRRIRRDLHDGLGPELAGVVLGLQRARRQIGSDPTTAASQLDALTAQTQQAIAEVRRLVYNLRPPTLDELGLLGALQEQARTLGAITVDGPSSPPALPAAVEVAAYRIALEAMTNIKRHANAEEANVRVSIDGALHIEIADNGGGLPDAYRAGVGINSMRERAAELGGCCAIEPVNPHGTVVRATLPLEST
jgi:two-component system, NarL family, sensor kinase